MTALAAELRRIVGESHVITRAMRLLVYRSDALPGLQRQPALAVFPGTRAELIAVVRALAAADAPFVARGAGTGLSGGALADDITLLGLHRLKRIIAIDPVARTATVEPGVVNALLTRAAVPFGLHFAPDPSSQSACTIGGNVAENSGGVHCLKYGMTLQNLVRVRGYLCDGEPVDIGTVGADTSGLDLLPLVAGSEGMLVVVTEVTVRLLLIPRVARCVMASFGTVAEAGDAVAAIIADGIIPAGLEMLDQAAARLVEPFARAGYDLEAAAVLLCESDGTPEEVEEEIARMTASLRASRATHVRVSESEAERQRFWAGRKSAFPAAGRVAPAYYCMDGTIPRRHLGAMLTFIQSLERRHGLRCPNVFHAGDGNLHPLILFDDGDADSVRRAEAFGADILEACVRLGGTVTGEHGVGVEKLGPMCQQFGRDELDAFLGVKRAFDPAGGLNPGKAIPTPHRCAEHGRMLVKRGALPFPDLPRF